MSIEDDLRELNDRDQVCFSLVLGLLGAVVAQYGPRTVQQCIALLDRYPHMLGLAAELGDMVMEQAGPDMIRRAIHPGPSGVVPDPPPDDGSGNKEGP